MMKRKASGVLFYDGKGNILIQDRRETSKYGEEYGFFGGGFEPGEDWQQALKREIHEELEFDIKDYKLFKHGKYLIKKADLEMEYWISLADMPNLDKIKAHEGKTALISINDINKLKMLPGDKKVLIELIDYIKKGRK